MSFRRKQPTKKEDKKKKKNSDNNNRVEGGAALPVVKKAEIRSSLVEKLEMRVWGSGRGSA